MCVYIDIKALQYEKVKGSWFFLQYRRFRQNHPAFVLGFLKLTPELSNTILLNFLTNALFLVPSRFVPGSSQSLTLSCMNSFFVLVKVHEVARPFAWLVTSPES